MTNANIIAVGGENLIDFVETEVFDGVPQYTANPGGGPFNIAIAAARQNCDVAYLTPISEDRLGRLLASRLIESGVRLSAPIVKEPTSLAVVSIEEGQPSYQFYRNDTAERQVTRSGLDVMLDEQPWAFHIGSLALSGGDDAEIWEGFFNACHDAGVITSLDPNVRPNLIPDRACYTARIERMAERADILKLSDEDLSWLYPDLSIDDAFEHLSTKSDGGIKVLTKGADGAIAIGKLGRAQVNAHPVPDLQDTVGAGDTFMASMLVWLCQQGIATNYDINQLNTDDLETMLERASRAAAINCGRQGCNPPTLEELKSNG